MFLPAVYRLSFEALTWSVEEVFYLIPELEDHGESLADKVGLFTPLPTTEGGGLLIMNAKAERLHVQDHDSWLALVMRTSITEGGLKAAV